MSRYRRDEAEAGCFFWHGTGDLKVIVSSGNFGLSPQLGLEPTPHTSEALVSASLS
jgi:hypothetical protein